VHALQVLRHDLMKLPSRAATHAEANAVTAEIAALQTEVERADTMTEVSSSSRSLSDDGSLVQLFMATFATPLY
jgi:hypothetical protein